MAEAMYAFGQLPASWDDMPLLPEELTLRVFQAWKIREKVWLALPDPRTGRTRPLCFRLQIVEEDRRHLCTKSGLWLHVFRKATTQPEPEPPADRLSAARAAASGEESEDSQVTLVMGEVEGRKRRRQS